MSKKPTGTVPPRNDAEYVASPGRSTRAADAWRPPHDGDYAREPTSGLWWSESKPDEYVDARTGHVLHVSRNMWHDPRQNVWYEVEARE